MIFFNGKQITPKLNGANLSRVMYNGRQIYPKVSAEGIDPDEASNGVYIYSNNGKLYNPSSWDTALNDSALGVAVITDDCKFAISKELPMVNNIKWSEALYGTNVSGILTTTSESTAITDYAGQNNTNLIRSAASGEDSSNNTAHYCYVQTLNGQHGYLPAAGELAAMYNNKSDIDEVLVLIGSKSISDRVDEFSSSAPYFWSSTEYSSYVAWYLNWGTGAIVSNRYNKHNSGSYLYAFPVFPIYSYPTLYISDNINRPFLTQEFSDLVNSYMSDEYKLIVYDLVDSEMQVISDYYCRDGSGAADEPHLVLKSDSVTSTPSGFAYGSSNVRGIDLSGMSALNYINGSIASGQIVLQSIKLPDSLQSIGDQAFYYCPSLEEVVIPNSVTTIGEQSFADCTKISKLVIGSGVTSIGSNSFKNCTSINDIEFYGTEEPEIGAGAFSGVNSIVKVPKNYSGTMFGTLNVDKALD